MSGALIWTTVTVTSVQLGDRVHARPAENAVEVHDMRPLPGGGKRLYLTDGSTYDMPRTGTLRAFRRRPP